MAVLALIPSFSFATPDQETQTLESLGQGASRDEAIADALGLAVNRVRGSSLPQDMLRTMFVGAMRDERTIRMTVLNDYRVRATRLSAAVGFIQDYQVQEASSDRKTGRWQARLTADVVDPAKRLAAREKTIMISLLPFRFMQEEEGEAGGPQLQQLMEQTLQKIASFRSGVEKIIHDQQRIDAVQPPEALTADVAAAVDNPAEAGWNKLSQASGATHFLTVQAEEFRMDAVEMRRGVKSGRLDGKFVFHYRIVRNDGETPSILKSGTFMADTHHPLLKHLAKAPTGQAIDDQEINRRMQASLETVERLFANVLLDELSPPDVITREGDNLLLRSGAIPLRIREQLVVLGAPTLEPDAATGLVLHSDGVRIAILEITAIKEGRIEARVMKGNTFGVQPGSIVRRMKSDSLTATTPETLENIVQVPECATPQSPCDFTSNELVLPGRETHTDPSHNNGRASDPTT